MTGPLYLLSMKIDIIKAGGFDLATKKAALQRPQKALQAGALAIVSISQRAFSDASLRPSPWRPLASSTLKRRKAEGRGSAVLMKTGELSRSPRIGQITSTVDVVSDRQYAAYHQLGTKRMPARPFFPFKSDGRPTAKAKDLVKTAVVRALSL